MNFEVDIPVLGTNIWYLGYEGKYFDNRQRMSYFVMWTDELHVWGQYNVCNADGSQSKCQRICAGFDWKEYVITSVNSKLHYNQNKN